MSISAILAFAALMLIMLIVSVYLLFERYSKLKEREWMFMIKQDNNKALSTLKITAYERLIVMLERITPSSVVMRLNASSPNAGLLQLEIVRSIREEFEHNISLQMYVGETCWARIRKAKDETLELVKVAYTRVLPESPAVELSREIFQLEAATGNAPVREAISAIRDEMARYF